MSGPLNDALGPDAVDNGQKDWTRQSMWIVALCFVVNMVDGMDVNIMSYIRAALTKDWGLSDTQMGTVMSAGTLGMGLGALFLTPFADRFGRKNVIMTALACMSVGMLACGFVDSVQGLMLARLCVGMGIGAVLTTMAALSAEVAPAKHQDMAVGFVQAGFALAAVATGFLVAYWAPLVGWQHLLIWAAAITTVMLPLAWWILPSKMRDVSAAKLSFSQAVATVFSPTYLVRSLLLLTGVFMGLMVLYTMLSWITKLAHGAGLSDANSIYAGAFYNIGAFIGTACMGLLTTRVRPGVLVPVMLSAAGVAMLVFGNVTMSVSGALFMAMLIGMMLQGGYNGMWPLAAASFPVAGRATGLGLVMGVGRLGAVVGPILAGALMDAKMSLPQILAVYCVPLAVCALCAALVGLSIKRFNPA